MTDGREVRMRGFVSRRLVRDALEWIDTQAFPLTESELLNVGDCRDRVLATDVLAPISVPEFHRSAMDGYALIGAETASAGEFEPLTFRLIGEAFPGRPCRAQVISGTAVRIMTGAPLPEGADAVVPVEFAEELAAAAASMPFVEIQAAVASGKNVGCRGEDIEWGSPLLPRGRCLRPQDAAILASVGMASVPVLRRPRVLILSTGNELVSPGETRHPYQIFDANSTLLRCLVERDGGEVVDSCCLGDNRDELRHQLVNSRVDVILISGGSSVGAEDHVPELVRELGELPIHGISMRPSSPAGMGRVGKSLVFLQPGNPVSCLCAYDFFAGRAIRRLAGRSTNWSYPVTSATLTRKIISAVGRLDYVRVHCQEGQAEPLAVGGASVLSSTVRADGFILITEDRDGYPEGSLVEVHLYDAI